MKKIREKYPRRIRKLLETKLCSRNLIKSINTLAVALVRYSGSISKWTREELWQMDKNTRKLMTMYEALNPRDDKDKLFMLREKWWELASPQYYIDASIQGLENYIKKSMGWLITTANCSCGNVSTDRKTIKTRKKNGRKNKCMNNLSVRLARLHSRRRGHGCKMEIYRKNWNSSSSSTKQHHKHQFC